MGRAAFLMDHRSSYSAIWNDRLQKTYQLMLSMEDRRPRKHYAWKRRCHGKMTA